MRLFLIVFVLALLSCNKETEVPKPELHPQMLYRNLHNAEVKYNQAKVIDIDNNGTNDFVFGVQLVGDPVLQRDRLQFLAFSREATYLLNDVNDQSPVLKTSDSISLHHNGYTWFEISAILLVEKITPLNGLVSWEGLWKHAHHQFLPVQIKKEESFYNGWIEISFDTTNEKIILHKAAICIEPNKTIKAGH